jgi:hypothetical protein
MMKPEIFTLSAAEYESLQLGEGGMVYLLFGEADGLIVDRGMFRFVYPSTNILLSRLSTHAARRPPAGFSIYTPAT